MNIPPVNETEITQEVVNRLIRELNRRLDELRKEWAAQRKELEALKK